MSKDALEHLSSLMDGEINKDTGRFLIRRLGSDIEMRATWARYHVVRDCLRHQEGSVLGSDFSARVRQALEQEDAVAARAKFAPRWLKPIAGAAIAASVALMAIVTVGPAPRSVNEASVDSLADSQSHSFVSPNSALSPILDTQEASTAGLTRSQERMNSYLLRHYQVAGSTGGKGFVTLVPIVISRNAVNNDEDEAVPTDQSELKNGTDSARQ